jgi:2-polyprenyl-6-methoxyphenol hydroxylase-like FAD-dependent oxidoreductase
MSKDKKKFIIVGGGPAGLTAALSLHMFCNVSTNQIEVYEKRTSPPSRTNYIILSIHCTSRLNSLGVLPILVKNGTIGDVECAMTICSKGCMKTKEYTSRPTPHSDYYPNKVEQMIQDQESGIGKMAVAMLDLENALRQRLTECGIKFSFGECSLESNNGSYDVVVDGQRKSANLIVLAEGSQRRIAKRDLNLVPIEKSIQEKMVRVNTTPLVGSWVSVLTTPIEKGSLKRLLYGDPIGDRQGICFVQIPDDLHDDEQEKYVRCAVQEHLDKVSSKATITSIEPTSFAVQDTIMPSLAVSNVLIMGDCARSGHFFTGLGSQFPMLTDADALIEAVKRLEQGQDISQVARYYDQSLKEAAAVFFEFNKESWYKKKCIAT